MAIESKIQWTQATWNPWHGCKKVSEGCKFCYMYRDKDRFGLDPTTVMRSIGKFKAPISWKDPKLVFTCSWSDWFIEEADQWRDAAWDVIRKTPHHTYQILTKRPERILDNLPEDWGDGWDNVWLGVSLENNNYYLRALELMAAPAKVRFLSCEPLIGPIDVSMNAFPDYGAGPDWSHRIKDLIHWVIVGGESGNETGKWRYRPCNINWIESIMNNCLETGVPVFIKQLGTHLAKEMNLKDRHGGNINEWPDHLRVRQMPKAYTHAKP
jgi:protein gp37